MSTIQVAESDTDAEIYRGLCTELVRYATAIVGPDEAKDVVSTVVLRILAKHHLSDLDEPRPYLYRAVLNEARSSRRKSGRIVVGLPALAADPPPSTDPDVVAAVRALPPRQRAATYLVYWMGCTIAQAATLMGTRPGTVGRYLHLARKHLRRALDA
jgi:DNA-directed RNA polymerase specialized sigma24 family protein